MRSFLSGQLAQNEQLEAQQTSFLFVRETCGQRPDVGDVMGARRRHWWSQIVTASRQLVFVAQLSSDRRMFAGKVTTHSMMVSSLHLKTPDARPFVCVCVCERARARACVRTCTRVCVCESVLKTTQLAVYPVSTRGYNWLFKMLPPFSSSFYHYTNRLIFSMWSCPTDFKLCKNSTFINIIDHVLQLCMIVLCSMINHIPHIHMTFLLEFSDIKI